MLLTMTNRFFFNVQSVAKHESTETDHVYKTVMVSYDPEHSLTAALHYFQNETKFNRKPSPHF